MKQKLLFTFIILWINLLSFGQSTYLQYHKYLWDQVNYTNVYFDNLSTCQSDVTLYTDAWGLLNGVWYPAECSVAINGVYAGTTTNGFMALSYFNPSTIYSVQIWSNGYNQTAIGANLYVFSPTASMPPTPTTTSVNICKNSTPQLNTLPLSGGTTSFKWYTSLQGDDLSLTAPTPDTSNVGTFTYYYSQVSPTGCESQRVQLTVNVIDPAAPTVTSPVNYVQGSVATPLTATSSSTGLLWYTSSTGGPGSTTAPTPNTSTVGSTSYWVASTTNEGCISVRREIVVNITAPSAATHLNFDGVNDYVSLASSSINNLSQGTIEAWIYPTASVLDNQTICSKQDNGINSYAIFTLGGSSAANGKLFYQSKNGASITSNSSIISNQWTHIAVTFNNVEAKLYLNGVLDNSISGDFSLPDDTSVTATTIGAWLGDGSGQYFKGNIEEFRVWNLNLSQSQINSNRYCELFGNENNLVTYYKFDEGLAYSNNLGVSTLNATKGINGSLNNFALTGSFSNWLAWSPVIKLNVPTLTTPVIYTLEDSPVALTATSGGTGLIWYTSSSSTIGTTTAPIPSTSVIGNTSYWVSSVNGYGCESSKVELVVSVIDCESTTWNGSVWSNGLPTIQKTAIFNANYNINTNLQACRVIVNNNAIVNLESNNTLTLRKTINVASGCTFEIKNNAILLQENPNDVNTGNVIVNRASSPLIRLDYTAWSSPVTGQNLLNFSPNTLTTRFYSYNPAGAGAWISLNPSTTNFDKGTGYIIRVDNLWSSTTASPYLGKFTGVLNNGTINKSVSTGNNLVGNPYPSPINADILVSDNTSLGINTLFFWTHTVPQNGSYTTHSNYATYNGYTSTGVAASAGGLTPDGIIQTGQGFFHNATSNGTLVFKNTQRLSSSNGQFLRQNQLNSIERHRIWLGLKSESNSYNQMAIVYITGATNGIDTNLESELYTNSPSNISSFLDNRKLVIQSRALPFNVSDEVVLSFVADHDGIYSISLENFDGLFTSQVVYLWDKTMNVLWDLKNSDYTFNSLTGNYNERFSIVYQNQILNQEEFLIDQVSIFYNNSEKEIHINSIDNLDSIQIFDISGRLLKSIGNINSQNYTVENNFDTKILIVKATSNNGSINVKKVII